MRFSAKIPAVLFCLLAAATASSAFSLNNLPFMSDAHIGLVTGVGTGVNFGFNAGFDIQDFTVGPELEQLITDVDYSAGINATRLGGYIKYYVNNDIAVNVHLGSFQLQVKERDIYYSSGGVEYVLLAGAQRYTGKYQAISVDIPWEGFKIVPKFIVNAVDGGGSVNEFNLNLAKSF